MRHRSLCWIFETQYQQTNFYFQLKKPLLVWKLSFSKLWNVTCSISPSISSNPYPSWYHWFLQHIRDRFSLLFKSTDSLQFLDLILHSIKCTTSEYIRTKAPWAQKKATNRKISFCKCTIFQHAGSPGFFKTGAAFLLSRLLSPFQPMKCQIRK